MLGYPGGNINHPHTHESTHSPHVLFPARGVNASDAHRRAAVEQTARYSNPCVSIVTLSRRLGSVDDLVVRRRRCRGSDGLAFLGHAEPRLLLRSVDGGSVAAHVLLTLRRLDLAPRPRWAQGLHRDRLRWLGLGLGLGLGRWCGCWLGLGCGRERGRGRGRGRGCGRQ